MRRAWRAVVVATGLLVLVSLVGCGEYVEDPNDVPTTTRPEPPPAQREPAPVGTPRRVGAGVTMMVHQVLRGEEARLVCLEAGAERKAGR